MTGDREYQVSVLRFPASAAAGKIWWPGASGELPAIGTVEVPDGAAVQLTVGRVPHSRQKRSRYGSSRKAVSLEFIRGLPAGSVCDLSLGRVVPASFAAVAHLAPGLRGLGVYLDDFGPDAPSVIAELTALERLALFGNDPIHPGDEPSLRLDDHALSAIADLPALESLSLLGGSYTEHGLRQLRRLPKLRHLHIEREGLTAPMFRFAAAMPALTELDGLDEFGDDGPMPPAQVQRVRAMLPHISVC
jgi:hypothetical protein